jgi:hypothetical protein
VMTVFVDGRHMYSVMTVLGRGCVVHICIALLSALVSPFAACSAPSDWSAVIDFGLICSRTSVTTTCATVSGRTGSANEAVASAGDEIGRDYPDRTETRMSRER